MRTFGGNFKLIVNQNYGPMNVEIYGLEDHGGGYPFIIGYDGKEIVEQELTRENEMSSLKEFKPLLRISMFRLDSLVKAFVAYANENKIHTEAEDHLKGKFEATEKHLEDMRELSKKVIDALISSKSPKVLIAHDDKIQIIKEG